MICVAAPQQILKKRGALRKGADYTYTTLWNFMQNGNNTMEEASFRDCMKVMRIRCGVRKWGFLFAEWSDI